MNGIIIVDKEKEMTSHDVIAKIKRHLQVKKIGHAGTLDPLATGVLVVMVNEATKLSNYLMADDKEYLCEIIIGTATTSEDADGEVIESCEVNSLSDVDSVLESLVGQLQQIPPMYSSVKLEGKKLYELARMGKVVERQPRSVEIFSLTRVSDIVYQNQQASFSFVARVSKGTYIRTLCVEIGKRLKFPAHMKELRRLSSGNLQIENAYTLNDIYNNEFKMINMLDAVANKKIIEVDDALAQDISYGKKIKIDCEEDEVVFAKNKQLLAIYQKEKNIYRARRVWN